MADEPMIHPSIYRWGRNVMYQRVRLTPTGNVHLCVQGKAICGRVMADYPLAKKATGEIGPLDICRQCSNNAAVNRGHV